ncbi:hypothetical protein SAMN05660649_00690 [Desulfotomaculum arcticum]|uniref:DUF2325 domain-containing protein n=1 Tax=Desulfotruncus arcticus DSM 17038 TaxID=1121424 RepID=A0A1I2PAL2_9FIRM|nr:DUF2325 domain-containing protein [Desulfotruncus arcticus]SFG10491.1 hypothetical protein SAMN05660649_00690 [Desulfotomaculum arcticum] [Desulfotruncus arcticus DSM 17038]
MARKGWTNINFDKLDEQKIEYRPIDFKNTTKQTDHCKKCFNCKQCMKKVLIIGGITKIKHLYKDLIENCGHKCIYLDGYMRRGDKLLEKKIIKCDLVFCPVDCNSHNACASAKKLCRKHGKPIKMLTSSSITNMVQAIQSINA